MASVLMSGCHRGDVVEASRAALERAVAARVPPSAVPKARWAAVRAVYRDRDHEPLWVDARRLRQRARDLIAALCSAEAQGLRARDYDLAGLRTALEAVYDESAEPEELAALDLRLTGLYLEYGADLLAGRLDPRAVDSGWYIRARRASVDSTLRAALRNESFEAMVAPLVPRQREYAEMVAGLAHYRALAANGGWPAVDRALRPGARGGRVASLRRRLALAGDLPKADTAGPAVYDRSVVAGVRRFQARHGLDTTGVADAATIAAMNVPVERRIRQLELNLERLRWLPQEYGERYVLVNIPEFELAAYDGGREALRMRVIVGEEYDGATPVFADTMSYVVFRPHWNVPARIVKDEVIPRAREDDRYLLANNYEIVGEDPDTGLIDPESIDWDDVDTTDLGFTVRQKPGPDNALGLVKFMFPNQFDVYMHDTPADHLFARSERALSHGCIRLEDPVRFAGFVLEGSGTGNGGEWSEARIREAMQAEEPERADVRRRLPVYVVYLTAFARGDRLQFRDDLYGADRRAMARLGSAPGDSASRSTCAALHELLEK